MRVQVRVEDVEDKGDVAAHLDAPQATAAALLGREARQRERDARARRRLSTAEEQQVLVQSAEQATDARLRPSRKRSGCRGRPTVASGASAASTEHGGEEAQHDRWTWNAKKSV